MIKIRFKTPITYYGGKQKLASKIISLLPPHVLYCEPFVGGAAVFFAKEPSQVEVINDTNKELMNFYRVVQQDFVALEREIRISLHSCTSTAKLVLFMLIPICSMKSKEPGRYEYIKASGWYSWSIEQMVSVNVKASKRKKKTEMLVANYPIN